MSKKCGQGFYTKTAEDVTWRSLTIDNKTMFSYAATKLHALIEYASYALFVTYKLIFKVN